jgi:hypothetical protein
MPIQPFLKKPVSVGLIWGAIGGIFLIIMTFISNSGLVQLSPYPVILIAAIITMKYSRPPDHIFNKLFIAGLFAFIIMSLVLYVYILTFINPGAGISFLGHLWRFGIIIGIGSISSLLLSFLAKPVN